MGLVMRWAFAVSAAWPASGCGPTSTREHADVVAVAVGNDNTCAILDGGRVRCWGLGWTSGTLSSENIGDDELPTKEVDVGGDVRQLAMGWAHGCAVVTGGAVRCWGKSHVGQTGYPIGDGNEDPIGDEESPAQMGDVDVGGPATLIAAGARQSCAVLQGGEVRCWGGNPSGELGLGRRLGGPSFPASIGDTETPAAVPPIDVGGSVRMIETARSRTCALLVDGTVRCWGSNEDGTLGYAVNPTADPYGCIECGEVFPGEDPTAFFCCSADPECCVGDDETPAEFGNVVDVGGRVEQLAVSDGGVCALLDTGAVRCWGSDRRSLGYSDLDPECSPCNTPDCCVGDDESPSTVGDLPLGGRAVAIAAGGFRFCAILEGGALRCWGTLGYDERVPGVPAATPAELGDIDIGGVVTQVAVGANHACAVLEGGRVRCWGSKQYGRLGDGDAPAACAVSEFSWDCARGPDCCIGDDEPPSAADEVPLFD